MNMLIIALYCFIMCQSLLASEAKQPFIAAYIMSVANNTAKDYRINLMIHDLQNIKKIKRKPLHVVHPYRQEIFEKRLHTKEITFLDLSYDIDPCQRNTYLFIENLYNEDESLYLHLCRRFKEERAMFIGSLKKKIGADPLKEPTVERLDFKFDPSKGSTTFLNIIFDDNALENMQISFSSIQGSRSP